jgi:hypothetical protein
MPLYLPPKSVGGTMAIAICARCSMKMYAGDRVKDPNNGLWGHKECMDAYDPWKLPARQAEDITVENPRPDDTLV